MRLPNRDKAYIPSVKLTEYLLSETHAVGKSKAKFFRIFGFNETNVAILEEGLLSMAQTETVAKIVQSLYGTKYIIEGFLETPSNTSVKVQTVWIVEVDDPRPRFVTAYPA
jgi:hypothetical protein